MAEFTYAKGRINESIEFISKEIKEFEKEYAGKSWKDYQNEAKIQKLIDRTVENILTALIEVSGTIVAEKGISAENYSEVMKSAAKIFGFKIEDQEVLAKLASLRNRLAHRYLDYKWDAIKYYKENSQLIIKYLSKILEGIKT
ncbi:MAG: HepT-like ribonuclease domain-containing protein [bacterium]